VERCGNGTALARQDPLVFSIANLDMPRSFRLARAAYWTLCICAYALALWCTAVLLFDVHLLPFETVIHTWSKEADFTFELSLIASVALTPLIYYFRQSKAYVRWGLGVWGFQLLFFAFPVY
jgi:hypothetical protein